MTCSGGDKINWHAHDLKWCSENKDHCPPKPPIVPVLNYQLKPWSQVIRPPMQCTRPVGDAMPKVTVVILAYKETESLSASLATYDAAGFLQVWECLGCCGAVACVLRFSHAHSRWELLCRPHTTSSLLMCPCATASEC